MAGTLYLTQTHQQVLQLLGMLARDSRKRFSALSYRDSAQER